MGLPGGGMFVLQDGLAIGWGDIREAVAVSARGPGYRTPYVAELYIRCLSGGIPRWTERMDLQGDSMSRYPHHFGWNGRRRLWAAAAVVAVQGRGFVEVRHRKWAVKDTVLKAETTD